MTVILERRKQMQQSYKSSSFLHEGMFFDFGTRRGVQVEHGTLPDLKRQILKFGEKKVATICRRECPKRGNNAEKCLQKCTWGPFLLFVK